MASHNFVDKLLFKVFGVKNYIIEHFPLLDINKDSIMLENGTNLHIYKRKSTYDLGVYEQEEFKNVALQVKNYYEQLNDGDGFVTLIKIDNVNKNLATYLHQKVGNEIIDKYNEEKVKIFENHKLIDVYYGIPNDLHTNPFKSLMGKLEATLLNGNELFSFLYDYFNPDFRTNDLDLKFVPKLTKQRIKNSEKLLNIIYDSYMEDTGEYVNIGDTHCKCYNIITPSINLNINDLISDLSHIKSNSMISIKIIKNDSKRSTLKTKATFANSALLSWTNSINAEIGHSINQLEKYMLKTHSSLCEIHINVILFNKDKEVLDKDEIQFEKWANAKAQLNKFDGVYEYINNIPGLKLTAIDPIYLPSEMIANLVLPSSFKNDVVTSSLLTNQQNYIVPFLVKDDERKVNSAAIIAPTGTGKSFLSCYLYLQRIIKCYMKKNFLSLIVDLGGSYLNLIEHLNNFLPEEDKIIYKRLKKSAFYNIFDLDFGLPIDDRMIDDKIMLIIQFLTIAIENINQKEESILNTGLRILYQEFIFGKLKKTTPDRTDTYLDIYMQSDMKDTKAFIEAMPTLVDLIQIISSDPTIINSYSREIIDDIIGKISVFTGTEYGRVFSKKSDELVLGKNIVIDFDLLLSENGGILPVLLLQYFISSRYQYFINDTFESYEKLFLIDEYPQFLKIKPAIEKTIDFLLKTGRKKKIDTYVIVQNPSTLHEDFFANMGLLMAFNLNLPAEINKLRKKLEFDEDFFSKISTLEYVKNVHSDMFVLDIERKKKQIVRFAPNEYERDIFLPKNANRNFEFNFSIDNYIVGIDKLDENMR